MEVNKRKTKREGFGGIMKLRNNILNHDWIGISMIFGFISIIAKLNSQIYLLENNFALVEAFKINSYIFFYVANIGFLFYLIQFWNERQIKKIIKENKISVI